MANTISGAISINTTPQGLIHDKKACLKACEDLHATASRLSEIQDFLDATLSIYISN
jgi:hypothetical protein